MKAVSHWSEHEIAAILELTVFIGVLQVFLLVLVLEGVANRDGALAER